MTTSTPQMIPIGVAFDRAFTLYSQQQFPACAALLKRILQTAPRYAAALHLLGVVTQQLGDTSAAIDLIRQAIEIEPQEAQFHANLGEMYRRLGQLEEAIAHGEQAVAVAPGMASAHSNLGIAYYDLKQLDKAEACQLQAIAIAPKLPAALNNLGSIRRDAKDLDGAIAYFRKVIALAPDYAEAYSNLGSTLAENDQPEEAIKVIVPMLQKFPNFAEAHSNLGGAFLALESLSEAEAAYRRALQLRPAYPEACIGLSRTLQENRQLDEALVLAEQALKLAPENADAHILMGSLMAESGYPKEAEESYREAIRLKPESAPAYLARGHLRMENGDMKGAEADFRHALGLDETNMGAKLALVQINKVKPDSPDMQALLEQMPNISDMSEPRAISLHFALGKCYEDTKQFDAAFTHYQAGCQLKRKRIHYSADDTDLTGKNIREFFTKETVDTLRGEACSSELPIFVLGMPRSGTTLTETIIASHPQVFGAGELHDIVQICARSRGGDDSGYPFNLSNISLAELKNMGQEYVESLQKRAPDSPRITDKMPANFNFLGLIHLMLPNAKIVHVKRNPVDTCLSCYTRLFNKSQYQSYDLAEIGRYYRNYALMMDHWRSVLPAGAFYDIQYEELVADQEGQARALLEYCGLEWDDACMDFHKTERNVRTASVTQVRQPIYKTSVEKWRQYEQHLEPLFEALGNLVPHR